MNQQVSFPADSRQTLQKGRACVNCRRRKVKCDGAKPLCGPCATCPSAFSDCEYTANGRSHSQILEEQISILQTRIEELERPDQPRSFVSLSKPIINRQPFSPSSPTNTIGLGPLLSQFHLQQKMSICPNHPSAQSMPTELPFFVLQALVHNFLHSASCFGFFLDTQAFHDAVTSRHGRRLPPVLMNVMYLWGVHLSKDDRITAYEPAFLVHALRSTAGSLSGTHPRTILHSIQASVLLAYYFIRNGRVLESQYHIAAAMSIALSAGLHRIRSPRGERPQEFGEERPPPLCSTAVEGERISAWWSVLTLNNCHGSPSNVSYGECGLRIDTPWPLDMRDYVEHPHLLPSQSSETVTKFLADVPDNARGDTALHAKASILFEEAMRISSRGDKRDYLHDIDILDNRIDALTASLPPIRSKRMLVVHSLCHGATIQLHRPFAKERMCSFLKALAAARVIVHTITRTDVPKLGLVDPVLALLWSSACFALNAGISRRQGNPKSCYSEAEVSDGVEVVIRAMEVFAPHCRLMNEKLNAVRRAYFEGPKARKDSE
ncbi:Zn(2)-C6 fungal-type domain-containing protein [Mycena sanguinolenta]|uniref:Zn(2)-C6 fungal-type domain-containing protein n=1 Tax=Mycena sanguinolenta TaxID=230812 RepID=A0A8H7CLB7_9AGAR|nr:Zn(2)-C6 fungal-type domain-containing protein [Mycena sanguinolenta]